MIDVRRRYKMATLADLISLLGGRCTCVERMSQVKAYLVSSLVLIQD